MKIPKKHLNQAIVCGEIYAADYFIIQLSQDNKKDWKELSKQVGVYAVAMSGTAYTDSVSTRYWKHLQKIISQIAESKFLFLVETSNCERFFK